MALFGRIPDILRDIYDDGLDEVLIFAFVFIFILLSGHEDNRPGECGDNAGILPLIIIAVVLLLFTTVNRTNDTPLEQTL